MICTASTDDTIGVWDVNTGERTLTVKMNGTYTYGCVYLGMINGRELLAASCDDRECRLIDLRTGEIVHKLESGHTGLVYCIIFNI